MSQKIDVEATLMKLMSRVTRLEDEIEALRKAFNFHSHGMNSYGMNNP